MLFQQAPSQAQLQVWASRISDGTDAPAFGSVMDGEGTPVAGGRCRGALQRYRKATNSRLTISPGALANTFNVVIGGFPGVPAELFPKHPELSGKLFGRTSRMRSRWASPVSGRLLNSRAFIPGNADGGSHGGAHPFAGARRNAYAVHFTLREWSTCSRGTLILTVVTE